MEESWRMDGGMMEQDSGDRGLAIWPFSPVCTAEWTGASRWGHFLQPHVGPADCWSQDRETSPSLKNSECDPPSICRTADSRPDSGITMCVCVCVCAAVESCSLKPPRATCHCNWKVGGAAGGGGWVFRGVCGWFVVLQIQYWRVTFKCLHVSQSNVPVFFLSLINGHHDSKKWFCEKISVLIQELSVIESQISVVLHLQKKRSN